MNPLQTLIQLALAEDIGSGDITSEAVFADVEQAAHAQIYAKQALVLSGLEVAEAVFKTVDKTLVWQASTQEGSLIEPKQTIATISGNVRSLLQAERVALNFLQQLSGIATLTRQFVDAVAGTNVIIRDTRKTIPGYRALSKAATRAGGAQNHRMGLYDQVLIKNNHIDALGSIATCVERARKKTNVKIQVEVRNATEAAEAVSAGADGLLLDNMSYEQATQLARQYRNQLELEVSGNVTLANVRRWAQTGVHAISIGALTHSAPAVDIAMGLRPRSPDFRYGTP